MYLENARSDFENYFSGKSKEKVVRYLMSFKKQQKLFLNYAKLVSKDTLEYENYFYISPVLFQSDLTRFLCTYLYFPLISRLWHDKIWRMLVVLSAL